MPNVEDLNNTIASAALLHMWSSIAKCFLPQQEKWNSGKENSTSWTISEW